MASRNILFSSYQNLLNPKMQTVTTRHLDQKMMRRLMRRGNNCRRIERCVSSCTVLQKARDIDEKQVGSIIRRSDVLSRDDYTAAVRKTEAKEITRDK